MLKYKIFTILFNLSINPPYVMPRKKVVIGTSVQEVQMNGSMTGCHVGAYP